LNEPMMSNTKPRLNLNQPSIAEVDEDDDDEDVFQKFDSNTDSRPRKSTNFSRINEDTFEEIKARQEREENEKRKILYESIDRISTHDCAPTT